MNLKRKLPTADLRKNYTIFMQIGIIATLAFFLGAFKLQIQGDGEVKEMIEEQEVVSIEEIIQTKHTKEPPPPPRPQVPTEVPNDEVIDDEIININTEISMNDRLSLPPPPKKDEEEEDQVFVVVEQMPELIGGLSALQEHIRYPDMARKAGVEGRVYVQFVVNEKGKVEKPKVIRGIGAGCDKEALRAISKVEFKPGMQRGRTVSVQYSVPIVFKLQN